MERALNDEAIVSMYFNDIANYPLLSEQEERDLAIRVAKGDAKARETLIKSNLRFVVKIAKDYQGSGLELPELISEGNIGLTYAVDKYNIDYGTRFVSYAIWWIRQSILKALSEKGRAVRLPQNRVLDYTRIKSESHRFEDEYGRVPTDEELSKMVSLTPDVIRDIRFAALPQVSLDAPLQNDSGDSSKSYMKDTITYQGSDFVYDMEEQERKDEILNTVNALPKKERDVIKMRFGLEGYGEMSLADIGEVMSLTKERIRQIEKEAIGHLKTMMSDRDVA